MINNFREEENKLKIQYLGQSGYTVTCLLAIDAILNSGCLPERATIVSYAYPKQSTQQEHLFLFWNWGYIPLVIVPSGFASGYQGEGPKGFSLAICMIRSKDIPLDGIYLNESDFRAIDKCQLDDPDDPLLQKIKAKSETLTWPWPLWVWDEDEFLLKSGQVWRRFYWRKPKTDLITEAVGDVDLYNGVVGQKLRLAMSKLSESEKAEEWQSSGILIRDAWIEFVQWLCQKKNVDTSGIGRSDVKKMLSKLGIDDEMLKLTTATFDLSLKNQHDRKISKYNATSCVVTTALIMQTLIDRFLFTDEVRKRVEEVFNA